MSLLETIKAADDIAHEVHTIEEWGVDIGIRGLSGSERSTMYTECMDAGGDKVDQNKMREYLLLYCVFDPETNEPLFTQDDVTTWVMGKNANVIDNIMKIALSFSGLGKDAQDELAKN